MVEGYGDRNDAADCAESVQKTHVTEGDCLALFTESDENLTHEWLVFVSEQVGWDCDLSGLCIFLKHVCI